MVMEVLKWMFYVGCALGVTGGLGYSILFALAGRGV